MQACILNYSAQTDLSALMAGLRVDPYGIKIMAPKGVLRLIYIQDIPSFTANILKQELLSLGADVALPKDSLVKKKLVSALILATEAQINKLLVKLKKQPYSLQQLGSLIRETLANFKKNRFVLKLPGKDLVIILLLWSGTKPLHRNLFKRQDQIKLETF